MTKTLVSAIGLLTLVLMTLIGQGAADVQAAAPPASTITVDVDLPSPSTGVPGGVLALRIFAPASPSAARYADGAPVLVYAPGGDSTGALTPPLRQAEDVIRIVFLFPGGNDPLSGRSSDGVYDHRGASSIAALRDVIRFAAGELPDSSGKTIDELLPVPVLHDNIGLLGASNGGNIVMAVAAEHGAELSGYLRYIVQWESPVSSQIATVDLGGVRLDCPGPRRSRLDAVNPRYVSYGPLVLDVDYSQITYDSGALKHPVFLDGDGDGHYTTVLDPATGCQTPDLNHNGVLGTNEDFPLGAYTDGVKHFYSRPATQAMADYGIFGSAWPTDIATVAEAGAYWSLREAVRFYGSALHNLPDLEGMVLASPEDHVQSAPDHPHIRQAFEGWDAAGAWVQINPDPAYLIQADPGLSGRTDLPANSPNTPPADWSDVGAYTVPEDVDTDVLQTAAVWQMADRAHAASSATPTVTPSPSPTTTPAVSPTVTPTSTRPIRRLYLPTTLRQLLSSNPPATPTPTPTITPTATPTAASFADVSFILGDPLPDKPIRPLLGVNAGPAPVGAPGNADLTTAYQDIGVTGVRSHDFYGPLDMAVIYPDRSQDPNDPASFDFTASDAAFAAILDGGFEPYFRLGDSWNNVAPPANATERANWVQAAVNVVRHYREGLWGGFNADIHYVEIWNEPDFVQFWPRPYTQLEFFQLYEETAKALKTALPDLKVGGPGFSPAGALTPNGQQFVSAFLEHVKTSEAPLDFLSWHLYANSPTDFVNAAGFYRGLLDDKGFTNVETHVTEWNTATKRVSQKEAVALREGGKGAALMSAAWIELQNMGVVMAAFYRGGDQGPGMIAGYGLFYADGQPKKMALAFSLWAQMAAHPERLILTPTPDSPLWAIAGRDADGEIALLIVNPNETAVTYRVENAGAPPQISEVNDAYASVHTFTPAGGLITIAGYTVQLLLFPSPVPPAAQRTEPYAVQLSADESSPATASGAPALWRTLSLNALHGWPDAVGNHLKIFDAAVDEKRNRIYVQGVLTPGIAVIDGATDTLIDNLESGYDDNDFHRTYLAVHPTTGVLYVADYSNETLRSIDPDAGVITGPVSLSAGPEYILLDPAANRIYLSLKLAHKIAVYDAADLTLLGEIDLDRGLPLGLALDPNTHRLYVADARPPTWAQRSRLLVIDTITLTEQTPITFVNATGHPVNFLELAPNSSDLFLTTPEELFRLGGDGAVRWVTALPDDAKVPLPWADTGKVYVISSDGLSPIRSALTVVDAATGALETTLDLQTGGAKWAAFNRHTGKLYTPGMEYTEVSVVDVRVPRVLGKIDIGNSVEDIAIAPAEGVAYFANRLGGSTVIAYQPESGAWREFATGGWPTAVDVDPGLNRLFVLSHYDGTVATYDLTTPLSPTLLGAASLGLSDTSDAISNQVVDATHHRVITTHPEHDSIVIVDGQNLNVVATIDDVPSFAYDPANTSARGHLQPAVDEDLNKLYVLVKKTHKVDVFDGAKGYAFLRTIDLSGQHWDNTFNDFLLWADSERHRLYAGLNIIDTTTDAVIGRLPRNAGQIVVGIDEAANRLYTVGVESPARGAVRTSAASASPLLYLYALDRDDYRVQSRTPLRELPYTPPYFALDLSRARFFAGYMQSAEVDIYGLNGAPTPSPTPTPTPPATPGSHIYLPLLQRPHPSPSSNRDMSVQPGHAVKQGLSDAGSY